MWIRVEREVLIESMRVKGAELKDKFEVFTAIFSQAWRVKMAGISGSNSYGAFNTLPSALMQRISN